MKSYILVFLEEKERTHKYTQRDGGRGKLEAESEVMNLQPKEHPRLAAASRSQNRGKEQILPKSL